MPQSEHPRYMTLGVKPTKPTFFFDVDKQEGYALEDLREFVKDAGIKNADYYETRGGVMVAGLTDPTTWDAVQDVLERTKASFPRATYPRNCRIARLRISPKWDANGEEVSPAPRLVLCTCKGKDGHAEKRVGYLDGYWTSK